MNKNLFYQRKDK